MSKKKEININFLLVGHTHGSLDQQFSVYSKKIKNKATKFIVSRLALQSLLERSYSPEHIWKRPSVSKQLQVVYDFKTMIEPYINNKLMYYTYPHVFKIFNFKGKAIMQYKMFSNHTEWLPNIPQNLQALAAATAAAAAAADTSSSVDNISELLAHVTLDVDINLLLKNSQNKLLEKCNLSANLMDNLENGNKTDILKAMANLLPQLSKMEKNIIAKSITRFDGLEDVPKQYQPLAENTDAVENPTTTISASMSIYDGLLITTCRKRNLRRN